MKKCPYCAEEIQDEAILCRYCGKDLPITTKAAPVPVPANEPSAPISFPTPVQFAPAERAKLQATPKVEPKKRTSNAGLLVVLFLMLAGLFGCWALTRGSSGGTTTSDPKSDAWYACREFIGRSLKAPKTAQYQSYDASQISSSGNSYTVLMYVDAENSFGALIRSTFICTTVQSGGNWNLISLNEQ